MGNIVGTSTTLITHYAQVMLRHYLFQALNYQWSFCILLLAYNMTIAASEIVPSVTHSLFPTSCVLCSELCRE